MSALDFVGLPGIPSGIWIDGSHFFIGPVTWKINRTRREVAFEAMNMTQTVTGAYDGDGLPIVLDNFTFEFQYSLDAWYFGGGNVSLGAPEIPKSAFSAALEALYSAGGVHTVAFQRAYLYQYALRAGQQTFWMRGDAAAQGFASFSDPSLAAHVSIPASSVPNPTTVYKPSVSNTDTPGASEVWISEQVSQHPSGKFLAFCKLGTAPSTPAMMSAALFQLFRVIVNVPRQDQTPSTEKATLMCAETN